MSRSSRAARIAAVLLLALVASLPCGGAAKLYLTNGQVIEGTDVWRDGDTYSIRTVGGDVMSIPAALVVRVGLSEEAQTQTENDEPSPPPQLTLSQPEQLAGSQVTPVTPSQQTAAIGPAAKFQRGIINPYWHPTSDWQDDPSDPNRNDFAPATFQKSIIDPDWEPTNALTKKPTDPDRNDFAPAEFQPSIIDSSWTPTDAFKQSPGLG